MRLIAIGISPLCGGPSGPPRAAMLLSGIGIFAEDIAGGAALGTLSVVNATGTPAYTLTDSDGSRVALTGANVTRGATAWDYETHQYVTFTISVSGVTPAIAPRTFLMIATNVLEVTLAALGLSPSTVVEGSIAGTVVGAITGKTSGSSLALTDDAGGRFDISGTNLVTGSTLTDYEVSTLHAVTIRETHPDAAPRDTALAVTVTNIADAPPLNALTLSANTVAENATIGAVVGAVLGKTSGSTLSLTGTAGGLFALSGSNIVTAGALDYETATSHSITLTETYAEAPNSPRATTLSITVTDITEAGLGPFTLAWTSADTELDNLTFTLTPALLEGDSITIYFDNNNPVTTPFTQDTKVISAIEAAAGTITFPGITTPLPTGVPTYCFAYIVRGAADADTNTVFKTLEAPVGGGTVAFDAASEKTDAGGVTTQTFLHTPVGTPSGVVVAMAWWSTTIAAPTSVKYGGVNMTNEGTVSQTSRIALYSLANPPTGPQNVEIIWADLTYVSSGCISVTGGSTTDVLRPPPIPTTGTISAGTVDAITVPSAVGELVVDALFGYASGITIAGGQTSRVAPANVGNQHFRMSTKPGAAPDASMSWTWTGGADSTARAHIAASFNT